MWNKENTAYILERYNEVRDDPYDYRIAVVEALSKELKVSKQSIISKLTNLGVYKKKEIPKSTAMTKEDFIKGIADKTRISENDLETLKNANRTALKLIYDSLVSL